MDTRKTNGKFDDDEKMHCGSKTESFTDSLPGSNESPEETSRWYMFIAVFWLTSFIKKAALKPLQFADLFELHSAFRAHTSTDRVQNAMERYIGLEELHSIESTGQEEINSGTKSQRVRRIKWALLKGMLYSERWKIIISLFLHAIYVIMQLAAPIILASLLNAPPLSNQAYSMVAALFLCQLLQALCFNNSQYIMRGAAMSVKAGLISMIFKKALRLGTKGRMEYPTGFIMNLIASDCSESYQAMSDVLVMPFEVISLSILIIVFAGPAGAAGLAFMLVATAASMIVSSLAINIERKALAATDERVQVTGEVINGIKIIKFFGWEASFLERLSGLRNRELKQHIKLRMIGASFSALMNVLPSFVNVILFSVYSALGNTVDAAAIFSILSIVNLIKLPIAVAPMAMQEVWSAVVSLERLAEFFAAEELSVDDKLKNLPQGSAIALNNASFKWAAPAPAAETLVTGDAFLTAESELAIPSVTAVDSESCSEFRLKGIDLSVKKGELVMVVGKVGSGKSSLIQALIGDMIHLDGKIEHSGGFGYSPQAAWLQNQSLRNNILFGKEFDEKRYNQVIQCCSLAKDLQLLSHGDMSQIGEKGVTLSGGQAARVNLARAVYSDADILLLDDPLAAVDSHVGRHILEECILGFCRDKTVVLVTHQLHIAYHADKIVVLEDGAVSEQGSYDELIAAGGGFKVLMQEHGRKPTDEESEAEKEPKIELAHFGSVLKECDEKGGDLIEEEERITGKVLMKYFAFYFENSGPLSKILLMISVFVVWQAVTVFANLWLTFWIKYQFGPSNSFYMGGLALLAIVQSFLIAFATVSLAKACINAGRNIHIKALGAILSAPMLFFETNPSGRIISRFSRDFGETDRMLPRNLQFVVEIFLNIFGTLVLIVYASPYMAIVIMGNTAPLQRSPLYAQVSESFSGVSVIRAFGATKQFISTQEMLQDSANRPTYLINCLNIWVSIRAEVFVAVLIGSMALLGVALQIDTSSLGLALSYCLSMMYLMNLLMRMIADTEARMNSVERLSHYITEIKPEGIPGAAVLPPTKIWPSEGAISFQNLSIKYRPELEPVLHSLTFDIPAGTKVGVVGRTGAGKSSIISAVFRLVEFWEGTICVDGVDISGLELSDLRRRLAIIPQAPILFDGTIRSNLDPLERHSDKDLWNVLDRCSLKNFVMDLGSKLESSVAEGGSNLSMGQRQLLCLGRAMLVKSKILLIDEATASVDFETDLYIQKVLREEFADCTILCIAHRLNTLMDYNKILVLESGRVMEFDSPCALANKPSSLFSALIDETGASNAQILRKIAESS
ncbi:Canalicular multispecific organic anion transporter 1 [Podochytrium sp. JEL0797]|nr:Canalicular multispecific organic anion transporter 1 [Podochytrium sp. JEL0797]